MNKLVKIGLILVGAAIVIAIAGFIFGWNASGFTGMAYIALALFAAAPLFFFGIVTIIIGLIRKRKPQTLAYQNGIVAPATNDRSWGDRNAKILYTISASVLLVTAVMMIPMLDNLSTDSINGWLYLLVIVPLEIIATLGPIAVIFLALFGAIGAKSTQLKLIGLGLIAIAFAAYVISV